MRETLLLSTAFQELTDEMIAVDEKIKELNDNTRSAWQSNRFGDVQELLGEFEPALEKEQQEVRNLILGEKHELLSHLRGLKSLNQRIERIDPDRIRQLERNIDSLDSISIPPDIPFPELEETTREHVRENIVEELEAIEVELMKPFQGTEVEDRVRTLIDGDSILLTAVNDEEIEKLRESLGEYVSIKLANE